MHITRRSSTLSRFTTFRLLIAALAATALLSAACGGDDDGSSSSNSNDSPVSTEKKANDTKANDVSNVSLDPCKLLTAEEVAAAIGNPVDEGQAGEAKGSPLGQAICTWSGQGGLSANSLLVSVERSKDFAKTLKDQGYTAKKLYEDGKKIATDATDVTGVGVAAYRSKNGLNVLVDGATFNVSLITSGKANDAQLADLAKKVATRLK
ncbi:MAG: DUF3558 domain-containing protein [Dehalococcoidia bacterium]|nr:DUF3558 domain-containing protein [Dehalococcoidia bacterium]